MGPMRRNAIWGAYEVPIDNFVDEMPQIVVDEYSVAVYRT